MEYFALINCRFVIADVLLSGVAEESCCWISALPALDGLTFHKLPKTVQLLQRLLEVTDVRGIPQNYFEVVRMVERLKRSTVRKREVSNMVEVITRIITLSQTKKFDNLNQSNVEHASKTMIYDICPTFSRLRRYLPLPQFSNPNKLGCCGGNFIKSPKLISIPFRIYTCIYNSNSLLDTYIKSIY